MRNCAISASTRLARTPVFALASLGDIADTRVRALRPDVVVVGGTERSVHGISAIAVARDLSSEALVPHQRRDRPALVHLGQHGQEAPVERLRQGGRRRARGSRLFTISAQHVVDHVANARVQEIPGVAHAAPVTHPEALAEGISAFLASSGVA